MGSDALRRRERVEIAVLGFRHDVATMAAPPTTTGMVSSRKLVLLGESAVGKSSLALRFCRNVFDDYRESTIGAAFLTQTLQLGPNTLKYELWDTAGQERYKSLAPMYYRNAHAAVVVYDITSAPSLLKAKAWIAELARQADPGIIICLAGNKLDLAATQRQVSVEEAQKYAQEEGLLWIECSAKSGDGVEQLFLDIGTSIITPPSLQRTDTLRTANKLQLDTPATAPGTKSRAGRPAGGLDLGRGASSGTTDGACAC